MPDIDLSRLAPLYRHDINQIKVTDPLTGQPLEGVLDPNRRVNIQFPQGQLVDPSTLRPQEIQGAIQQASEEPPWQEFGGQTDIIDLPDEDYNLARISSKRQFLDDMKLANELMPGSPEYLAFAEEAQATFRARNAKINMEREKSEMKFKEIRQNPNLDPQEKRQMMVQYYSANPIYKAPQIQEPAIPKPNEMYGKAPWWAAVASPEQVQNYISRVGAPPSTTVNVNTADMQKNIKQQLDSVKEGEEGIRAFVSNPENADIVRNMDLGMETDTKGILTLQVKPKKAPTGEQINQKQMTELLRQKVSEINKLAADKSLYGPVEGRLNKIAMETIGTVPEAVKLQQLLQSLIIRVYMLSGKQINQIEMNMLRELQPQLDDPDTTFKTRLDGFYNELKAMSEISDELWSQLGLKTTKQAMPQTKQVEPVKPNVDQIAEKFGF